MYALFCASSDLVAFRNVTGALAIFAVSECMAKLRSDLGISADAAFYECKSKSITECIGLVSGKKYNDRSVNRVENMFVVAAGNDKARWTEGPGWKDKGCIAYVDGPKRSGIFYNAWGPQKIQLFRQGLCSVDSIELDQSYTIDEAKIQCERTGQFE